MARRAAVPLASLPVSLPTIPIPADTDVEAVGAKFAARLDSLDVIDLTRDAYWRDLLALTDTFRTFHTAEKILASWRKLTNRREACHFGLDINGARIERGNFIRAKFLFRTRNPDTRPALCSGLLDVVLDMNGDWKIWNLTTLVERVTPWPDVDALPAVLPTIRSIKPSKTSSRNHPHQQEVPEIDVVVIGAGHSGLSVLGHLKVLGVSALGIEKSADIGRSTKHQLSYCSDALADNI